MFPELRQAVCATKGEGDNRYLAAYYVADRDLDEDAMRQHLALAVARLHDSSLLCPAGCAAGLAERQDRPQGPAGDGRESQRQPAPPRPGLEQQIADIWEDILRFRGMGRDESFFRVGGNSLLAVRMQAEVRKRLGLEFAVGEFYGAPTIEALAAGRMIAPTSNAPKAATAETAGSSDGKKLAPMIVAR